jgi:hypothetical protein
MPAKGAFNFSEVGAEGLREFNVPCVAAIDCPEQTPIDFATQTSSPAVLVLPGQV